MAAPHVEPASPYRPMPESPFFHALHAELVVSPPLEANARFALVTFAERAQSAYLPELRQLMAQLLTELTAAARPAAPRRRQ